LAQILQKENVVRNLEVDVQTKTGKPITVLASVDKISLSEFNQAFVLGTFIDISERKRAENAVQESEDQFRRAIQEAPIPIILFAEDGQVLQLSQAFTELTGYQLKDVPTFNDWLDKIIRGGEASKIRRDIRSLFKGAKRSVEMEFPIVTSDGRIRHWDFSASSPGKLRDGRCFIVAKALDMTERKALQAEFGCTRSYWRSLEQRTKQLQMPSGWRLLGKLRGWLGMTSAIRYKPLWAICTY
jgi:PAS domain S-box-containing protein